LNNKDVVIESEKQKQQDLQTQHSAASKDQQDEIKRLLAIVQAITPFMLLDDNLATMKTPKDFKQ
jgi:hypothetical protein